MSPGLWRAQLIVDGRPATPDVARAELVWETDPETGSVRARATVHGRGRLEWLGFELADGRRGTVPPALGQPVLGDGWFAALEHPGAEGLALAVDADLDRGPFVAPLLVYGDTPAGAELSGVWDEVDRVRASPPRTVTLANNWYQLGYTGRMDEVAVVAELDGFGAVAARHGVDLDHYCLDDPWDGAWAPETGLWGRLDPGRFPGGLSALQESARGRVGGMGLWISPWGGYFDRHDARVAWGRRHGFEVQDGQWPRLCGAGDRYLAHLREAMSRFTRAGVGYWKIDGVQFDCPDVDHGHATGPGGRTAQMDRFTSLLDDIRAVDRDAVLAFTTGSNPSPWWLRHADFVWRGGLDDDAPEEFDGGRHERFATYIDTCLDGLRTSAMPVSSIVTFSLVENGLRAYRDEGEGPEAWARHCWLMVGRGSLHHDLYVAPDSLSEQEWAVLGTALRWARDQATVLARSRMVGGRPQAGEPYGFVSAAQGRAVVCLRNPGGQGRAASVDLGGEVGDLEPVFGRAGAIGVRAGGTSVEAELEPFEVVVVSGRWRRGTRPGPPG